MRVVKEFHVMEIRISIFSWNNKYLLKYEQGMVEQTYKVNETEVGSEEDLSVFYSEQFLQTIQKRFDDMHQSLRSALANL